MIDREELDELNHKFDEIQLEKLQHTKARLKTVGYAIIFIVILTLTFKSGCAEPITDEFHINTIDIPHNKSFTLNITLSSNHTLYINRIDNESRLEIEFPSFKTFLNDTEIIWFDVNITENVSENVTLVSLFNLTNNLNNNSYLYSIVYHFDLVSGEVINTTVIEQKDFFVTIVKGNYLVNITTNLLPKTGKLHYDIGGLYGEQLNVTCPKGWLTCPKPVKFNNKNRTDFDIKYEVPLSSFVGNKTYWVNLTSGNKTKKTKITFQIMEPDITFMNYVYPENCFVSLDNNDLFAVKYDCVLESQKSIIDNAILYLKQKQNSLNESFCEEICPVKIETEYVMVGNISNNVRQDYEICRTDRDNYKFTLNSCLDDKSDLITNVSKLQYSLNNNETECMSSVFETSVRLKNEADENKSNTAKDFWFWMIGIHLFEITLIITFIWYKKHKKGEWQSW